MGPSPSLGGGGPAGWSIFCRQRISILSFVANDQLGSGKLTLIIWARTLATGSFCARAM